MKIFVNKTELDVTLEHEKTMGEIFSSLEMDMEKHGATITAVSIDGVEIPVCDFDTMFAVPIEKVSRADIETASSQDIKNMLKNFAAQLIPLTGALEDIPVQFQTGNNTKAMKTVADFADSMEFFFRIIPLIALFSNDFKDVVIANKTIAETVADFRPILEDFLSAFNKTDTVLAGDIAEYEITPRLRDMICVFEKF